MDDYRRDTREHESMEQVLATIREAIHAHSAGHQSAPEPAPQAQDMRTPADDLLDDMHDDHIVWEPAPRSHAGPVHPQPAHAEPAHAESGHAEPAHEEPGHAEPAPAGSFPAGSLRAGHAPAMQPRHEAHEHAPWSGHAPNGHTHHGQARTGAAGAGTTSTLSAHASVERAASGSESHGDGEFGRTSAGDHTVAESPMSPARRSAMEMRQKWRAAASLFPTRPPQPRQQEVETPSAAQHRQPAAGAKVIAMPERNTAAVNGALALDPASATDVREQHRQAAPLSDDVRHKVHSALDRLDRLEQAKQALGGEEALRQLVSDLLQPMLQRWLDNNLADIVERRVAEEIARITGRRR